MGWYLLGINILAFLLYGLDKSLAKKKMYRVSEYSLLVVSFFGGSIGSLLGMKLFHHKTKKIKFWIFNIITFDIDIIYFIKQLFITNIIK